MDTILNATEKHLCPRCILRDRKLLAKMRLFAMQMDSN